ncbi:hypothetical protein NESM_000827800 [Novymonas esmeraldas]|uniref:Uncharacterized protein n=1 Tax=Novymonas esmeraldas TaxID=1808958 RepID=A0AAW0F050_9TRYP
MRPCVVSLSHVARCRYPPVALTGRCFLLRPRLSANAAAAHRLDSPSPSPLDLECLELTQVESGSRDRRGMVPGSLAGNSYYAHRYRSSGGAGRSSQTAAEPPARLRNGDVVLRLILSAVPRELAHKRVVDVTGMQTSFHNVSERHDRALATVEEAMQTMHLHDGHEVPALQRGDVDLVRLQPRCVYIPPSSSPSRSGGDGPVSVGLAKLSPTLRPLSNPDVLLAQRRQLSFRSEMEAVQTAQIMASLVAELRHGREGRGAHWGALDDWSTAVLRPIVRDGCVLAMRLCLPTLSRGR